jgi:hypothetical protein
MRRRGIYYPSLNRWCTESLDGEYGGRHGRGGDAVRTPLLLTSSAQAFYTPRVPILRLRRALPTRSVFAPSTVGGETKAAQAMMERPGSKCGRGRWCAIGAAVKRVDVDVNAVTMQATGVGERGAGDGERPVCMLGIQYRRCCTMGSCDEWGRTKAGHERRRE